MHWNKTFLYQLLPTDDARRVERQQSPAGTTSDPSHRRKYRSLFLFIFILLVSYIAISVLLSGFSSPGFYSNYNPTNEIQTVPIRVSLNSDSPQSSSTPNRSIPLESIFTSSSKITLSSTSSPATEAMVYTSPVVPNSNTENASLTIETNTPTAIPSTNSLKSPTFSSELSTSTQAFTSIVGPSSIAPLQPRTSISNSSSFSSRENDLSSSDEMSSTYEYSSENKDESESDETKENESSSTSTPPQDPEMACHIPNLKPFDKTIAHLIETPDYVNCAEYFPMLFESTFESTLVPITDILGYDYVKSCCFSTVKREKGTDDNGYVIYKKCHPLSFEKETKISAKDNEFIAIYCEIVDATSKNDTTYSKLVDMHIFVPEKARVEKRVKTYYDNLENRLANNESNRDGNDGMLRENERLNVVVLGIDAVSHMNFIRTMPETYSYLTNNLSAVEMNGFNKIGDNTFPNVAAMLTSLNKKEMKSCEKEKTFDACPFVWNLYRDAGFRTSFVEDETRMSAFNYLKEGFKTPPTDYYYRPFGVAAEELIASHKKMNARMCYGPRLGFEVLLNYLQKMAYFMGSKKRYFQFIWATSLTHDYLNDGNLGDESLLSTLQWFQDEDYFNHTIFILMSDHGIRWGHIRDFHQGQLEERLPFLYFIVPTWFKKRYSQAFNNLKMNQDRLTTPFDLHSTLLDLVNLSSLRSANIKKREKELVQLEMKRKLPRSISHFLPIPKSRTCQMADIDDHYCTCHDTEIMETNQPIVSQLANFAVFAINKILSAYPECSQLSLDHVKRAEAVGTRFKRTFQIAFTTAPGNASFEASIGQKKKGRWKISSSISRTNLYGNQSHCVKEIEVKLYCFCIDLIGLALPED